MRVRVGLSTLTQNPRAGQRSQPEPNLIAGSGWVGFGLARVLAQPTCERQRETSWGRSWLVHCLLICLVCSLIPSIPV
jgi:hypothetical protein